MASPLQLTGVTPIIPTPFTADEQIDRAALTACVKFAADRGMKSVCLPAYASEFYKLNEAERILVVETALEASAGRVAIMAQANHPSARHAVALAKRYESLGAAMISFAIPRIFSLPEDDLLTYCRTICDSVSLPILIQDFNPGGSTVGGDFARRLADCCANFKYLKLEESLMSRKIRNIIEATEGRIGVLEGWGGMYMLELIPAGICGLMPGLGVSDILQQVWTDGQAGRRDAAMDIFQVALPQIMFSLQSSELFNWVEKRLLQKRGVIPESATHVRSATWTPDAETLAFGDWLNARVAAAGSALKL